MGAWRPKHVEWPCRNKTCTVLHQAGVSFDRHRTYKCNIVARSCYHCCGRIPISITYCVRMLIALGIKYKMRKSSLQARNLSFSTHPHFNSYPLSSQEIRHIDFLTSVFGCRRHKNCTTNKQPTGRGSRLASQHKVVQWLLLLHIREVLGSNLGCETGYGKG